MKKQQNIQAIILGCCKGNPKFQRKLVDQFADRLYGICIRYMKDKGTAKDMLQESLLKIFKSIHSFDASKASLITWMSTITVRTCLRNLERQTLDVVHMEDNENSLPFVPDVLDKLNSEDLVNLINLLPDAYKDVFNLYVIDGFSHKEIGEVLDISNEASRSRLKRAKEILKKYINNIEIERSWKNII